jgi:hypothetical protein
MIELTELETTVLYYMLCDGQRQYFGGWYFFSERTRRKLDKYFGVKAYENQEQWNKTIESIQKKTGVLVRGSKQAHRGHCWSVDRKKLLDFWLSNHPSLQGFTYTDLLEAAGMV